VKKTKKWDKRALIIEEKFANNWRPQPLHKIANKLKKRFGLGFLRPKMCHKRHRNTKEILLADLDRKVMKGVDYILPKEKYYKPKCACRGTKVNGKCLYNEQCKQPAVIYNAMWTPTNNNYIGKSQEFFQKRGNDHVQALGVYFKKRKKYLKYIASQQQTTAKKRKNQTQNSNQNRPPIKNKI